MQSKTPIHTQKRQRPTPPTANELLNELKLGNRWQSLTFNSDNLVDDWKLLVVSDDELNDLNLSIIKKANKIAVHFTDNANCISFIRLYHSARISNLDNPDPVSHFIRLSQPAQKGEVIIQRGGWSSIYFTEGSDDWLVYNAVFEGTYEILEKDKQRILKIHHNNHYWFFYSYDPMTYKGLVKSFQKDRADFYLIDFNSHNLLGNWTLYAVTNERYKFNEEELYLSVRYDDECYIINFKTDATNQLWLSMPNYCNQIKIPFTTKENGIVADFNQIISTNGKCDIPEYYKDANESIIHNAIYNGTYQILQNDNGLLLKINHNDRILFFVSQSYNDKEQAYWEQHRRK